MQDGFCSIAYDDDVSILRLALTGATMGRTCSICFRERPHERFGARGYAARVCKECRKLPKSEQDWVNQELRRHSSNVPPLEILLIDDCQIIAAVNRQLREAADNDYEQ